MSTEREALIKVAASHAWLAFGDCRAYDQYDKGRLLSAAEADSLARAVLAQPAEQAPSAQPGFVLVPVDPTQAMKKAARNWHS